MFYFQSYSIFYIFIFSITFSPYNMDLIGEIVEKDVVEPVAPVAPSAPSTGFPTRMKRLRWKRDKIDRKPNHIRDEAKPVAESQPTQPELATELGISKSGTNDGIESEAEKIHRENLERMAAMSVEEIEEERAEILRTLNPKLVEGLLKRSEKRAAKHDNHNHVHTNHVHAEGYNGWIGGMRTAKGFEDLSQLDKDDVEKALGINRETIDNNEDGVSESIEGLGSESHKVDKALSKKVTFDTVATVKYEDLDESIHLNEEAWEDVDDLNDMIPNTNIPNEEIAPDDYQFGADDEQYEEKLGVHFPKPKPTKEDIDLNDPQFFDKLHEKYYPDLPKETAKMSWMVDPVPTHVPKTYESVSDMRFDFNGNLVELEGEESSKDVPTHAGLHHHSENPHMAGYTLPELAHLARSVLPGQRSISIRTLGRILHKLGRHKYNILPVDDDVDEEVSQMIEQFEGLMWDLIEQLQITETLTEAADETKTKHLSVRTYALEALWLWKEGGGRPKKKEEVDMIAGHLQG